MTTGASSHYERYVGRLQNVKVVSSTEKESHEISFRYSKPLSVLVTSLYISASHQIGRLRLKPLRHFSLGITAWLKTLSLSSGLNSRRL